MTNHHKTTSKRGVPYGKHYSSSDADRQVFYEYGFNEILSSVPQNRLEEIISGLAMKGNQSKTTDFAELNQRVRSTYGHFLSKGKWDEKKVSQKQQEGAIRSLAELALARQRPLYLSIDDTVILGVYLFSLLFAT